jgi:hypothetical protein
LISSAREIAAKPVVDGVDSGQQARFRAIVARPEKLKFYQCVGEIDLTVSDPRGKSSGSGSHV